MALEGRPQPAPSELAALAGRGDRSAVGTYGFASGGLIVEAGKLPGEPFAPLAARVELPADWRFVVTWPRGEQGLAGEAERNVFRELPPVEQATTARLRAEVDDELLPAARAGDFERFAASLYRYGRLAGECFAAGQGGVFASPAHRPAGRGDSLAGRRWRRSKLVGPERVCPLGKFRRGRRLCPRLANAGRP